MKVFAILTACAMSAAGATYYFSSSDTCPLAGCPVASTGGCCSGDATKTDSCATPCPACATDCLECCTVCELCCEAGAKVTTTAKADCCAAGDVCCVSGATCCGDKANSGPAAVATSAVVAGATLK